MLTVLPGCVTPVYPRWRGEHDPETEKSQSVYGLSPLARGTLPIPPRLLFSHRFIPAGAGNTVPRLLSCARTPVYPRWRGEHVIRLCLVSQIHGLSPLARGTQDPADPDYLGRRFIPAGAGNTCPVVFAVDLPAVYPRWRGEHAVVYFGGFSPRGLSPLARGTQWCLHLKLSPRRFIPAGAGNT